MVISQQIVKEDYHLILDFLDEVNLLIGNLLKKIDQLDCKDIYFNQHILADTKRSLATIEESANYFHLNRLEESANQAKHLFSLNIKNQEISEDNLNLLKKSIVELKNLANQAKSRGIEILENDSCFSEVKPIASKSFSIIANPRESMWSEIDFTTFEKLPTMTNFEIFSISMKSFISLLAKQFNKEVKVNILSDIKKIDNQFAYDLNCILVEIIKNSIEHGLETADRRLSLGKEEDGLIEVIISSSLDSFYLTVIDDGCGFDSNDIRDSIEKKLSGFDRIDSLVKEYSGIKEIFSKLNKGTTVEIKLPLSNIEKFIQID